MRDDVAKRFDAWIDPVTKTQNFCGEDWHEQMQFNEYLENVFEVSKTCLLPFGHKGKHEWTDDDKWGVKFK